jgi:hypothetical protein
MEHIACGVRHGCVLNTQMRINNMKQNRLIMIFGLLAVVWVLVGCSFGQMFSSSDEPDSLTVSEMTISGTVLENNQGCAADADCYLTVETEDGTFTVIYGEGRRLPVEGQALCDANPDMYNFGFSVAIGAEVEIYARVREDGTLATCYDPQYTIQVLSEGDAPMNAGEVLTFTGTIVEHINDCIFDGICAWVVESDGTRYTVIYSPGMMMCPNPNGIIEEIAIGDTVAVTAEVVGENELLLCNSTDYTLRKVQ